MNWSIIIIITTQLLFTTSDLLARTHMSKHGFTLDAFLNSWFIFYFSIRIIAMFGQLYIFTAIELGKTMALFGAISIILANLLGFLILKEILSPTTYVGITLAVIAFIVLALT